MPQVAVVVVLAQLLHSVQAVAENLPHNLDKHGKRAA
jgi:hypothetical protein